MPHTFQTIRRRVLARFGDLLSVTATKNGTTTVFHDEDTLVGQPGRFAAREILFTGGRNMGEMRYIDASSRSQSSITMARPLPYAVQIGDTADITNAYGIGVTFRAVQDAINYAIDVARDYALLPASHDIGEPYTAETGPLSVPEAMVGVSAVMWQPADGGPFQQVQKAHSFGGNGWSLDKANHAVVINGLASTKAEGRILRVYGYELPEHLLCDDDTTSVDLEWLIDAATSHLCLDTLLSRQASGDWGSKGLFYANRADAVRSRLTPTLSPSFERF